MTIKASELRALILAAGLCVCLVGSSKAENTDYVATLRESAEAAAASNKPDSSAVSKKADSSTVSNKHAKPIVRHAKYNADSKSAKDEKKTTTASAAQTGDNSTQMPSSIANALAQLTAPDTPGAANNNLSQTVPSTSGVQATPDQVVAADQLNDIDRALYAETPVVPTSAPAPVSMALLMARSDEGSTWDRTSLIGRIFIGFGALLTMASAVRMFIA